MIKDKKLNYKELTAHIIANKISHDYFTIVKEFPVEPENFVETWVKHNLKKTTAKMKQLIWCFFLLYLIDRRKKRIK